MQQVLIHRILLKRVNLANLKSDVDKLHIDKFKNAPSSLSSLKSKVDKLDIRKLETALLLLNDVTKNEVVQKIEYNELVKKVNSINTTDTSDLVRKKNWL